jgi:hypothetical protein
VFEKLDTGIYEESARIVTFHTSEGRLGLWIKALHVLYYENLGKVEDINVTWTDSPENWSDPNNSETCIKIELKTVEGTLIYNVTVFISTGTIRVQGIQYKLFINYHFNILTEILNLLSDHQRDD